jgi:hypothetical protein
MTYRARLRQIDLTREHLKAVLADMSFKDYAVKQGYDYLLELLDQKETWLKQQATPGVELVEGCVYSLPLLFEGGMANLNFTTPDGAQFLLNRDLQRYLKPISVPEKVQKQGELIL